MFQPSGEDPEVRKVFVVSMLPWSSLVLFNAEPAKLVLEFFATEYPDLKDEGTRIRQARAQGYEVLASFRLPSSDWQAYYAGLAEAMKDARARRGDHEVYVRTERERDLYEAHGEDYGYLCLVLQITDDAG